MRWVVALGLGASLLGQPPTFSVDVHLVRLLVTVRDNYGRPVGTLTREDFQVFDNGVRQEVKIFERYTGQPLSITLLIDTSGSTAKDLRYETDSVRKFMGALMREGNPDDAAAIWSFNYDIRNNVPFTRNLAQINAALKGLKAEGGTSLYDALIYSSRDLAERDGRHVIVLVTDGGDTTSAHRFQAAVEAVQQADAVVYAIVVIPITNDAGRNIGGENALATMGADTGGRVFSPSDAAGLDEAFATILTDLRTQYLLAYTPKGIPPARERYHRLGVKVGKPGLHVSSRSGYYGVSDGSFGSAPGRGRTNVH